MTILSLSLAQLKSRPFNSALSICMFALGMGIISLLLHFEQYTQNQISGNLAGIDLVVGAKGSPLQLMMSSVLHADNPTGNISLDEAKKITKNPLVKQTIPIALGDNYKGFRIVGTSKEYVTLFQGKLQTGEWNKHTMEVLIGSSVANNTGLKIGDKFAGVHGFMEEGHHHDEHKYVVSGILKPTGKVADRLIITNVESVWKVHEDNHHECEHNDDDCEHVHEHDHTNHAMENILHKVEHHEELSEHEIEQYHKHKGGIEIDKESTSKEITALLVFYRNPMAAITLPRMINQNTTMQAASPAIELNRLMALLGFGFDALRILAWVVILFSGINIMIHLLNKLNQEINEIALLRSLGVGKFKILLLLFAQSIVLAVSGWLTSMLIVRVAILIINSTSSDLLISMPLHFIGKEAIILAYALGVGIASAIIPAIRAYRTDIHFLLNKI
ncbi:ABC transporter permease [Saccharicrinis fermentans]|uniref:Lipoprotein releasing system n=1 Tax=Saccharicrinis fermentans DSM 9555 = JCM 21142 TaxID=869213 RepID=W7YGU0_9BACT|nr:ABC transporter permease [Saccharicrinis fermentans]GAF03606.1 lipoprotein releasing system [Saccharicrinis fermentans DSM 9555 = JCM 21142]